MPRISPTDTKAFLKLGRQALELGLPRGDLEQVWVGAGLLMYQALAAPDRGNGASKAARIALQLVDATLAKRADTTRVECKRGCSYCCHSLVSVSAPEVFLMTEWLRHNYATANPALLSDLEAQTADRIDTPMDTLKRASQPCVFLKAGACSIYAIRPVNCRRTMSSSAHSCEIAFSGGPPVTTYIVEAMQKGIYVRGLLQAAVHAAGLPMSTYELSQAFHVAVSDPDAERNWLDGVDVFEKLTAQTALGALEGSVLDWSRKIRTAAG